MRISAIIASIEQYAHPSLQEKWDNTGLQLGDVSAECTGVMICLEATPDIVEQAIQNGCNLIITHHPLFFSSIKRLTGSSLVGATAINAIGAGITIYSSHTASDSTHHGVSAILADKLGIKPLRVLSPLPDQIVHLQVVVPQENAQEVQAALFDAGAGALGKYDCCSFNVDGNGTFRPLDGASPAVGEIGIHQDVKETCINVVLHRHLMSQVENVLLEVHPYETPAYSFIPLLNEQKNIGLGIYGISDANLSAAHFVEHVKATLKCQAVRTTPIDNDPDIKIRRVALCGGAGSEFIDKAIAMGAQAYITADLKYHDFVNYRDKILLIDAGHYETEAPIKEKFMQIVKENFPHTPVFCASTNDNPINYV